MPLLKESGNLVDVRNARIYPATLTIADEKIVDITATGTGRGRFIIPPLIDAHVHIESSMLVPSEFARLAAVHGMRQWIRRARLARFTGCQNVGLSSRHNVFISARTMMLQVLSAVLIGRTIMRSSSAALSDGIPSSVVPTWFVHALTSADTGATTMS